MDPTTGGPLDFIRSLLAGRQQMGGGNGGFGSLGGLLGWGQPGSPPGGVLPGGTGPTGTASPGAGGPNGGLPMSSLGPGAPPPVGAPMNIQPGAAGPPPNPSAPGLWSPGGNSANNQLAQTMAMRLLQSPQIQPVNWMSMGRSV